MSVTMAVQDLDAVLAELDLMARLAGMALCERYEDWAGAPFTGRSENHLSVWEKTSEPVGL